jgi:hypothetical protein
MAVKLSPLAGAGWQFFDNLGTPLAGGLLYTYTAGTTTPQATYTSAAGTIANTNPIVLDAAGRTANQTWLTTGGAYKFVLQTPAAVTIGTYDNISGINDLTGAPFAPTAGSTSITTLGTITTGTWNATQIGVSYGGTGLTAIPARSAPVANTANVYTTITPGAGQSIRINAGNTAWEAYTPADLTSPTITNATLITPTAATIKSATAGTPTIFQDSGGVQIGTLARAWVNFNGDAVTIRGSFNVSSLVRNSAGNYRINFTNTLGSTSYATGSTCSEDLTTSGAMTFIKMISQSATSVNIVSYGYNGSPGDSLYCSIVCFI